MRTIAFSEPGALISCRTSAAAGSLMLDVRAMKIHDLKDKRGRVFAFEVPNTLLTKRGVCRLVRSIPDARLLSGRAELREDEFCVFEVRGQKFTAWEPFGDNSRYWIGPEPPSWCEQVSIVRDAFARHKFLKSILA